MKRLVIVLIILLGAADDAQRGVMAAEAQADGAQLNTDEHAVRAWLQANAIRLDTVEAGRGSADLQPLRRVVGNARIVALGEATHGSREFFQLKHRLLEFLVTEMGFTVFAIEAIMPEAFDVNRYVLTGHGDAAKALAGISIGPRLYDTQELLELIEWMRRYNSDPAHTRKVKFYGFDIQSAARPAKVVVGYLRKVDPQRAGIADRELAMLTNPYTASAFVRRMSAEKAKTADFVRGLLGEFDTEKARYVRRSSVADWTIARQHAELLLQNISLLQTELGSAAGGNLRDQLMAANLRWILEHEGASAKAVVWAHNAHVWVWNDASAPNVAMGLQLRRMFGSDMVAFGFAFNEGAFQSQEVATTPGRRLRAFEVPPAPTGSLDAVLTSAGLEIAAIDLRTLPSFGPVNRWFAAPRWTRCCIGGVYSDQLANNFSLSQMVQDVYDGLLFVRRTTPSRPLEVPDISRQKLTQPSNADFEQGETGHVPPEWRAPASFRRYDFDIRTTDSQCYSGTRCALISRAPREHYGEVAGTLTQTIDATPYRGKQVTLGAAARAQQKGAANRSWVTLSIAKQAAGPSAIAFEALHPVVSGRWKTLQVTAAVPNDAETITFGLVLVGDGKAWLDSIALTATDSGAGDTGPAVGERGSIGSNYAAARR